MRWLMPSHNLSCGGTGGGPLCQLLTLLEALKRKSSEWGEGATWDLVSEGGVW